MAGSKITLIGLEKFLAPDSVFDELTLPEGIDKETLIGTIILRCQEFEVLYPDPEFMQSAVKVWGMKNYWTFKKWIDLINKKYDPLYNKDYYEEITDKHEGTANSTGNTRENTDSLRTNDLTHEEDYTRTDDLSHSEDYTRTDNLTDTNDTTITHSEKAYNDSNFVGTTQDVTDQDQGHSGTQRNAGTGTDSGTVRNAGSGSDTGTVLDEGHSNGEYSNKNSDRSQDTHSYHGFGNIGITSAQELFLREAEVARFNLYEQIADLFCQEFCLMVY